MLDLGIDATLLENLKEKSDEIGKDEQAGRDMADEIRKLLEKETLSVFDYFIAALALEKLSEHEKALCYYNKCIQMLPKSSLRCAISGMASRVKSKMEPENMEHYILAAAYFEAAAKMETIPWRINKWEIACEEMKRQRIYMWREH